MIDPNAQYGFTPRAHWRRRIWRFKLRFCYAHRSLKHKRTEISFMLQASGLCAGSSRIRSAELTVMKLCWIRLRASALKKRKEIIIIITKMTKWCTQTSWSLKWNFHTLKRDTIAQGRFKSNVEMPMFSELLRRDATIPLRRIYVLYVDWLPISSQLRGLDKRLKLMPAWRYISFSV